MRKPTSRFIHRITKHNMSFKLNQILVIVSNESDIR